MKLKLTRRECAQEGIFSELSDENGQILFYTLEHSYQCRPKIPSGVFTCNRGKHRLHGMTKDFTTFEIAGVKGHKNLLFHWGNFNKDSDGCVLVGMQRVGSIIVQSREAFDKFMQLLEGVDQFELTVV